MDFWGQDLENEGPKDTNQNRNWTDPTYDALYLAAHSQNAPIHRSTVCEPRGILQAFEWNKKLINTERVRITIDSLFSFDEFFWCSEYCRIRTC